MTSKILLLFALVTGIIFKSTTILLALWMMPTLAAYTIDRTIGKSKTLCVGLMNFAGCFPFLLKFWTTFGEQTLENALSMAADYKIVITIYALAAGGYAIDLAVTGITASFIAQRSEARIKSIEKQQKQLIDLWGDKVTGKYQLDEQGFPVKNVQHRTRL